MPSGAHLLAFAVTALIFVAIPGPSVLFTVSRALTVGRRGALLTVIGNGVGVYLQVLLVAAGLGAIVARSVAVYTILKIVGAAYLVYLGVQAIRHRHRKVAAAGTAGRQVGARRRQAVRDGFVVGVTNPKGIVFFVAVMPQFSDPDRGPVGLQIAVLGTLCVVIALLSDSLWAVIAGTARDWFVRRPGRLARVNAGGGLMMIGLGARFATTGRPE